MIKLFSLALFFLSIASQREFRRHTSKFKDEAENKKETARINAEMAAALRKITLETDKINSRPDDEYQFLIHRQINTKKEAYRRLNSESLANSHLFVPGNKSHQGKTEPNNHNVSNHIYLSPTELTKTLRNLSRKRAANSKKRLLLS